MSLMEMMQKRRSMRKFTAEAVSEADINAILQAGMLTPNGKGLRPWSFVVIDDEAMLRDLVNCRKGGAKMLETATAAIAVYSDSDKTDTYIEDSSLALGYMQLMASELGIGSCWLQLRLRPSNEEGVNAEEYVTARLGSPENQKVEALLVMGHVEEMNTPNEVPEIGANVHYNKW